MYEAITDLMQAIQNTSGQTNANPNGKVDPPPQITSIKAESLAPGIHKVQIIYNNPVQRGIIYHFEFSDNADFRAGSTILSQSGPSRDHIVNLGAGNIFWRGFSQYPTSAPNSPVYAPAPLDAGGAARTAPITGTGSGTDDSELPRGAAGFGFTADRSPRLPR